MCDNYRPVYLFAAADQATASTNLIIAGDCNSGSTGHDGYTLPPGA